MVTHSVPSSPRSNDAASSASSRASSSMGASSSGTGDSGRPNSPPPRGDTDDDDSNDDGNDDDADDDDTATDRRLRRDRAGHGGREVCVATARLARMALLPLPRPTMAGCDTLATSPSPSACPGPAALEPRTSWPSRKVTRPVRLRFRRRGGGERRGLARTSFRHAEAGSSTPSRISSMGSMSGLWSASSIHCKPSPDADTPNGAGDGIGPTSSMSRGVSAGLTARWLTITGTGMASPSLSSATGAASAECDGSPLRAASCGSWDGSAAGPPPLAVGVDSAFALCRLRLNHWRIWDGAQTVGDARTVLRAQRSTATGRRTRATGIPVWLARSAYWSRDGRGDDSKARRSTAFAAGGG